MGMLYFVPARRFPEGRVPEVVKARRLTPEGGVALEDLGLGHLDGAQLDARQVSSGPGGAAGIVLSLRVPANQRGYYPATQHWMPVERGDLYVGWPSDTKPSPETFLRRDALPGLYPVVMADGSTWEFRPADVMPRVYTYNGAGEPDLLQQRCYEGHTAAAEWLFDYLVTDGGSVRPYSDVVERFVVCLQARYHIGVIEFVALGLLAEHLTGRITCAAVGLVYDEVMGKKDPGAE